MTQKDGYYSHFTVIKESQVASFSNIPSILCLVSGRIRTKDADSETFPVGQESSHPRLLIRNTYDFKK